MGDVITFLQFLQKLEQGRLIPTEQIEHLSDILKSTLRKNLSNGVYDSLEDLLESQLNGNEQNSLFIDILETTPKPKEKDTLTKLTEFLDNLSSNTQDFKYDLEFEVPSKHIEYSYIIKDPDLGYIIKYRIVQGYSKYEYSTPISYLNSDHINTIWEAIQEMNSNE
jgi:hypothetical protein